MEREAATFTALRYTWPTDRHSTTFKQELHKPPPNMQDIQKTGCEPGLTYSLKPVLAHLLAGLFFQLHGSSQGIQRFWKEDSDRVTDPEAELPSSADPSAAQQNSARATEGSEVGKDCSANIKSCLVAQSSSAVFVYFYFIHGFKPPVCISN